MEWGSQLCSQGSGVSLYLTCFSLGQLHKPCKAMQTAERQRHLNAQTFFSKAQLYGTGNYLTQSLGNLIIHAVLVQMYCDVRPHRRRP